MASTLNRNYPEIQGEFEAEDEFEAEFETSSRRGEFEAEDEDEDFLGTIGGIGKTLDGLLGGGNREYEAEFEFEAEAETEEEAEEEYEDEAFVNPVRRIYPDAELMAHLSHEGGADFKRGRGRGVLRRAGPDRVEAHPAGGGRPGPQRPGADPRHDGAGPPAAAQPGDAQVHYGDAGDPAADGAEPGGPGGVGPAGHARTSRSRRLARIAGRVLRTPPERDRAVRAVRTFDRRYHRRSRRPSSGATAPRRRRRAARRGPRGAARRALTAADTGICGGRGRCRT